MRQLNSEGEYMCLKADKVWMYKDVQVDMCIVCMRAQCECEYVRMGESLREDMCVQMIGYQSLSSRKTIKLKGKITSQGKVNSRPIQTINQVFLSYANS